MKPQKVNLAMAEFQSDLFSRTTYRVHNIDVCIPRPKEKIFKSNMKRKVTKEWHLSESLFRDYKMDNELLLTDCFEFDFRHMLRPKLKDTTSLELLKYTLRKYYPCILELYKIQAALGKQTNLFAITWN